MLQDGLLPEQEIFFYNIQLSSFGESMDAVALHSWS